MEKAFYTRTEVATWLRITPGYLSNLVTEHDAFKPSRPGIYAKRHVEIIGRIWAGELTKDEGLALWRMELRRGKRKHTSATPSITPDA